MDDEKLYTQADLDEARDEGFDDGKTEGYDEGFADGREEGYDNGYSEGQSEGHDEGFNEALGIIKDKCEDLEI